MNRSAQIAFAIILGACATARAQAEDSELDTIVARPPEIATAVRAGAILPSTLAAQIGATAGLAVGFAGYDGARSVPIMSAIGEVRVWGPFALRGGVEYSDVRKVARPTIGGRAQFLRQDRHGLDGSISVFYRPEGFNEPEGEIESFVSVGRRFDRISILGNLVYGQDPEGNERDGEVRLASLYAIGRWTVGVDSRLRFAIGTQKSAMAMTEPKLDVLAGPIAAATVGPVALFAQAGPSVLKVAGSTSVGIAGLAGVGSVF
jgi:hypothetical protein